MHESPATPFTAQTRKKRRGLAAGGTRLLPLELRRWYDTHGGGHGRTPNAKRQPVSLRKRSFNATPFLQFSEEAEQDTP